MKFPIKKSRSFFRKIGSCASYASYASCASYACRASENRRMFGIKTMGKNAFRRLRNPSTACGAVPIPRGGRSEASRFLSKPRIQPRVQGLNPGRFNGGYGVPRGFKGGSKPSAPCGRLSEAEHPKRKGATLLRPLSAVNRNLPGNSHSRASAPCDFRFPPCFFPHSGRMASIPLIP